MSESTPPTSLILYQTEDGRTRIQCRFEGDTLWLTQVQLAELFETSVPNINLHLKAIYAERELAEAATIKSHLMVRTEGSRQITRPVLHYSLEAILAVGYRVRSHRGTQFRQWATARLTEYLEKGFTMDDERLKNPPGQGQKDYFDELLERIRDIRSSERRFYQKALDIYATRWTTSPMRRPRSGSLPRCKTRCTGPRMGTPPLRSSRSGRMHQSLSWACKRRVLAGSCGRMMWASPKTTSAKASCRC